MRGGAGSPSSLGQRQTPQELKCGVGLAPPLRGTHVKSTSPAQSLGKEPTGPANKAMTPFSRTAQNAVGESSEQVLPDGREWHGKAKRSLAPTALTAGSVGGCPGLTQRASKERSALHSPDLSLTPVLTPCPSQGTWQEAGVAFPQVLHHYLLRTGSDSALARLHGPVVTAG